MKYYINGLKTDKQTFELKMIETLKDDLIDLFEEDVKKIEKDVYNLGFDKFLYNTLQEYKKELKDYNQVMINYIEFKTKKKHSKKCFFLCL